ncbi:uncharacterized protein BJX67DRAFT_382918 [Aspergillus lucknowensis]|uniref:Ankyrin repeat protein n=1 Tax=Aspergillus lucknowensis TaxID=176173 RepID=A0ABR4LLR3_9EURO
MVVSRASSSPLVAAIRSDDGDGSGTQKQAIAKKLLERCTNVNNVPPDKDVTPLQEALKKGDAKTAIFLLENGADPGCEWEKQPVLYLATLFQDMSVVRLHLDRGIDPSFTFEDKKYKVVVLDGGVIQQVEGILDELNLNRTEVKAAGIDYFAVEI